jgi:hypothetical protein
MYRLVRRFWSFSDCAVDALLRRPGLNSVEDIP